MLDKLKSLFFEKVESGDNSSEKSGNLNKNVKQDDVVQNKVPNVTPREVTTSQGTVDDKLLGVLASAIQKANIDGFDYLEYKESIKSLEKMDMSEATRFQSALAMAKTMGANPQRLIQSAEYYLGVLDEERKKFGEVMEHQRKGKIGDKGERVKQMETLVQQKLQEIERIKKEIATLNESIDKQKKEIENGIQKIEQTKVNFDASFSKVYGAIKSDIEKMKTYLK